MNEKDFQNIFLKNKIEISDNGFSERIIRQLSERKSILPQIMMTVLIIIAIVFIFITQDITFLIEQIIGLVISISQLKAPSTSSVIAYFGFLSIIGIIGYTLVQTDVGE